MRARLPTSDPRPPSRDEIEHARENERFLAESRIERARAHREHAAQLDARERQKVEADERAERMREEEADAVQRWSRGGR